MFQISRLTKPAFTMSVIAGALLLAGGCSTFDPDCTPEKAAKNAAMKSTIGIGNGCTAAETAKDSVEGAVKKDDDDE